MGVYHYKAFSSSGASVSGKITALTREAALDALHRRELMPTDISESSAPQRTRWWERELTGSGRLSQTQLSMLSRDLATLIDAELPLDEALRIVALQPLLARHVRSTIDNVLEGVSDGQSLSEAMASSGRFPEVYWSLVRAGEASGSLGHVLTDLADHLERAEEIRQKIVSALIYPAVLLVAALLTLVVIWSVLVPTLVPVLENAGAPLPPVLRFMVDTQSLLADYWPALVVAGLGCAALLIGVISDRRLRGIWHRGMLALPIAGGIIRKRETARFGRTMATLLKSGVPLLDAITIMSRTHGNLAYGEAVAKAADELALGSSLGATLRESNLFTELSQRLVSVGEQTGRLEAMLDRVATIYEAALQRDLQRIAGLASPVLTLVIGVVVGGLMLSVLSTLVGINELALK